MLPRRAARQGAVASVVFFVAVAPGAGHAGHRSPGIFSQNCAALKRCNIPLEERDPQVNAVPVELAQQAPKGHLRPLGHPDFDDSWAGEVDVVEDMDPKIFWSEYWPKKPFLLKGFAKQSPAFVKWKDDSYLARHFGHHKAKCEPKNEDRLTDYCGSFKMGSLVKCNRDGLVPYTETHMKLGKFISRMRNASFDKYVVTQMPDAMGSDFIVPNVHSCGQRDPADPGPEKGGRWMTQMYENNFWLSYNEGRSFSSSVIHYDMNHQIMCLFDGVKEWIMWDLSTEAGKIPMWSQYYDRSSHSASGSDDSPVDPERVDLLSWPGFQKARWMNATMEAGDCLYTPALLLHYVRSWGRSVAAMTMFQQEERYDPSCGGETPGTPQPLSAYDVVWSFPEEDPSLMGWNVIKMGYPNWKRTVLRALVNRARRTEGGLKRKEFVKIIKGLASRPGRFPGAPARAEAAFAAMQPDPEGAVSAAQLFRSRELRYLLKDLVVFQEGGSGEQEEDTEVDRYDLRGDKTQRRAEL